MNYKILTDLSKIKKEKCEYCLGRGTRYYADEEPKTKCPECLGTGNKPFQIEYKAGECDECYGCGQMTHCVKCNGTGKLHTVVGDIVEIPRSNDFFKQWDYAIKHDKIDVIKLKFLSINSDKTKAMVVQIG